MSNTIATLVGTNGSGHACARHIVWAANGSLWWAFGLTGTTTLASYSSPDGVTWTARATFTMTNIHRNNGCGLAVDYKNIGSTDVFHIAMLQQFAGTGSDAVYEIRATASGTTLTFHTTQTGTVSTSGGGTSDTNDGGSILIASDNKVVIGSGWLTASRGVAGAHTTAADAGTAEQMTALTWTNDGDLDFGQVQIALNAGLVDIGSGAVGYVATDGNTTTNMTGLCYYRWNGTTWDTPASINRYVNGGSTFTSADQNDWGLVARTTSDIHVVYRSGTNTYVHRRGTGANSQAGWVAGQSIPTQNSKAAAGLALASDGTSVWLFVVDSAAANNVMWIKWDGTSWGTWATLEATSATRLFLGVSPKVQNGQLACYWVEGAVLMVTMLAISSTPVVAIPPYQAPFARISGLSVG